MQNQSIKYIYMNAIICQQLKAQNIPSAFQIIFIILMNQVELLFKILKDHLVQNIQEFNRTNKDEQSMLNAVAIILRNTNKIVFYPKIENFRKIQGEINHLIDTEILLLRRADNSRSFAGQVCLPGGKVQGNQTIVQAAIRQTYQQTGLVLKQSELVGIISQKFNAIFRRANVNVYAVSSIFFISERSQITLNRQEMSEYNWLPLRYFMTDTIYHPHLLDMSYLKPITVDFQKYSNIQYIQWAGVDVGMKNNLFGLTLYILGYFAGGFLPAIDKSLNLLQTQALNESNTVKKVEIQKIKQQLLQKQYQLIKFKDEYFQQYPIIFKQERYMSQQDKQRTLQSYSLLIKRFYFLLPRL